MSAVTLIALALLSPSLASAEMPKLKVLTLSIFTGTTHVDFSRIYTQIYDVRKLDADVVCLQEAYDNRVIALYRDFLGDYNAHAVGVNSNSLTTAIISGLPLTSGMRAVQEGNILGLSILVKKRLQAAADRFPKAGIFSVQASSSTLTKLAENVKPKGYLATRLEADGFSAVVVNTHLSNGVENALRLRQVQELALEIDGGDIGNPHGSYPVILCADTNADGRQPEMKWLRERAGYVDTYFVENPDLGRAPHGGATWDDANPLTVSLH